MPQEQTAADGDHVVVKHTPQPGEWIRRAGEDIRAGATILEAGTRLRAQEIGLAASVGIARLPVYRKVRAALFSTGNELVMPGEPLPPGAIYNSNRFTLTGLLRMLGCEVEDLGIVPDTLDATREALRQRGRDERRDRDLGRGVGGRRGSRQARGRRRGTSGPLADRDEAGPAARVRRGATRRASGEASFIGLPGNPVSSFVTFVLFVRPFVLRLQGATAVDAARLRDARRLRLAEARSPGASSCA